MCKVCNPTIGNLKQGMAKSPMGNNQIPVPVTFKSIMTKKIMKSRLLNAGLIACALLMTLSGCSTDETVTDEKGTEAKSMKITVSDGNFTSAENSAAKTRATDTESGTSFTSGDAIGVFVVNSDNTLALTNAKYTYNGSKWLNSSDTEYLPYYDGAKDVA